MYHEMSTSTTSTLHWQCSSSHVPFTEPRNNRFKVPPLEVAVIVKNAKLPLMVCFGFSCPLRQFSVNFKRFPKIDGERKENLEIREEERKKSVAGPCPTIKNSN